MTIAKQTTAIEAGASAIAALTMLIAKLHMAIARQTTAFEVSENEVFKGEFTFFALRAAIACSLAGLNLEFYDAVLAHAPVFSLSLFACPKSNQKGPQQSMYGLIAG